MKAAALPVLLVLASAARAEPDEDAAHRADRLRTAQLNRSAAASVTKRGPARREGYRAARDRYEQDREQYERDLADWRARVDACRAGDRDACR